MQSGPRKRTKPLTQTFGFSDAEQTPFLKKLGALELARILADQHPNLAAMIAGLEFERLLRCKAKNEGIKSPESRPKRNPLIEELKRKEVLLPEQSIDLQDVWQKRNRAVHPDENRLESEEVETMIDRIEKYCAAWAVRSKQGTNPRTRGC